MAAALAVPELVAALLLIVAGLAKLRSPAPAALAVGVPAWLVQGFAAFELGLGGVAVVTGGTVPALLMAVMYCGFALLTLRLSREGEACGCFGAPESPASPLQSVLSIGLAVACGVAALADAHGLGWVLSRPAGPVLVVCAGTVGSAYGLVLAYTQLPALWRAWSPA
ncbi:MAG TPA: MauE/DoxX family redox-associated membrane protein [Solirubrobacteraceae bacterium]|nr:MauE/DoxX family redox-associated membrane protein [Solirubrobacteraceae bacterium]